MARQGSVGKAEPPWLVDDRDDPTRSGNRPNASSEGDDDRCSCPKRRVRREHADALDLMRPPGPKALGRRGESLGASAEDRSFAQMVVAHRQFAGKRRPSLGVGRLGDFSGGQQPTHRRRAARADDAHCSSQTLGSRVSTLQAGVPPGSRYRQRTTSR